MCGRGVRERADSSECTEHVLDCRHGSYISHANKLPVLLEHIYMEECLGGGMLVCKMSLKTKTPILRPLSLEVRVYTAG